MLNIIIVLQFKDKIIRRELFNKYYINIKCLFLSSLQNIVNQFFIINCLFLIILSKQYFDFFYFYFVFCLFFSYEFFRGSYSNGIFDYYFYCQESIGYYYFYVVYDW